MSPALAEESEDLSAIRPEPRPMPMARALSTMRGGDFSGAREAARSVGPVAEDIIEWHRLREGRGTYPEVRSFLDRRPDWPGLGWLRKRSEASVVAAGPEAIRRFFAEAPAQTARGALAHAEVLSSDGKGAEARAVIVSAWRSFDMSATEQQMFLTRHAGLLRPHHEARLDHLLWRGWFGDARRMFELVDEDWRKLARARIALRRMANGVDALIEAVPERLQQDPGLAHARFEWRVRKGRWEDAKALLLDRSRAPERLGRPEEWANRRRALARDELRDGNPSQAYKLAAGHHMQEGAHYADLEWLAGFIALWKLDDPVQALAHFKNHDNAVQSPISKGRAGYWIGRAYDALGDREKALENWRMGARYQTSFYGLLAAEAAGLPFDVGLAEPDPEWRGTALTGDSLFQAGMLLLEAGEINLAERFWVQLAEQLTTEDAARLGRAAVDLGQPHLAVKIGKAVARRGDILAGPYYALHPLAEAKLSIPTEMALAIARRESEFDPVVVSGAGAMGLMQLMPATAAEVAAALGLSGGHSRSRLTTDPVYNARLGTAFLESLADRFDGNVIMVSAAYNAGPSRPTRWMRERGDPRGTNLDAMIYWIETIPFRETRNYVMRVSESLPIYRARLGRKALPRPFSAELLGSTLLEAAE